MIHTNTAAESASFVQAGERRNFNFFAETILFYIVFGFHPKKLKGLMNGW